MKLVTEAYAVMLTEGYIMFVTLLMLKERVFFNLLMLQGKKSAMNI